MKTLLILPPRKYWPYVSEGDNYLCPLHLACLAGALRQADIEVEILDCLAEKIGWKKLTEKIKQINPDIVGIGENHALFAEEAARAFKLIKTINPKIITIAGGSHFTHLYKEYLSENYLDLVVLGEGEITLVELIREIQKKEPRFSEVKGIAFKEQGRVVLTKPRELIKDLDALPFPAFDLLPMEQYGQSKFLFNPGGATLEHSRGCTSDCSFCVWWTQMAEVQELSGNRQLVPKWRTKSPQRTVAEIEYLYKNYNKKFFTFVDGSWNISAKFNKEFSELIIQKNLKIEWHAFLRVDCLLRDEAQGILALMVKAGLRHVCIGIETADDNKLKEMNKGFYNLNDTTRIYKIFKDKYPEVFIQGTFIVGDREETKESLWQRYDLAKKLALDHPAFHPITPVPGTKLYVEAVKHNWLETKNWNDYDWANPVMASKYLSREDIVYELYLINRKLIDLRWFIKGLFSKYAHKRNMYIWWFIVTLRIIFGDISRTLNPLKRENFTSLYKPKWYDK